MSQERNKPSAYEVWRERATAELRGRTAEELIWKTAEGLDIKPIYFAEDVAGLSESTGLPGEFPFTRGARSTMYAGQPWTMRQYAGFSSAEESNAFYRRALEGGQRGLSVAFDLPTHRGYDSDHPRATGDVGKAGVAIDSVEDMKVLFAGIPLDGVSVSMTMNGAVLPVLACFIVAAEESGVDEARLTGTIQNDILKEYIVRNTFIYPPEPSLRIVADVIEYASRRMPKFNPVSISGYHMAEAGAPADLEVAFTLCNGLEYVRAAIARGLKVDAFAPRLSFFFATGMNFFMEVAKLRAARSLWAKLVKEKFEPRDQKSLILRMHCQTSGISLSRQHPYNNIVRTTIEAMAAVLGGTQSLHTNAFDEAVALPSDEAARVARATQLIIEHETGVKYVVDPLGGSFFVEALTDALAKKALKTIEEVESLGGMAKVVGTAMPKVRIEEAAARRQVRLDLGEDVIVGVNRYTSNDGPEIPVRKVDGGSVSAIQLARLARVKESRDRNAVDAALAALHAAAESSHENLLGLAIIAARARATVGEISSALESVWGRYQPVVPTTAGIFARAYVDRSDWRDLRAAVEALAERYGRRPRLLVAKLGQDGHDRGARLIATGFVDLGFDVDLGPLFQTPSEVAQQAVDNDVHVLGISSQAAGHLALVPEVIRELGRLGASDIRVLCGGIIPPGDHEELRRAGVSAIFGPGTTIVDAARAVVELLQESPA